jgi:pimeloyl-ACP methyl ester carboxylesterase
MLYIVVKNYILIGRVGVMKYSFSVLAFVFSYIIFAGSGGICMDTVSQPDYTVLDRPEILSVLFHPRKEMDGQSSGAGGQEVFIPVAENVRIGGRFHLAEKENVNILFFHGNGEIVADYNELGPFYNRMGINFLAVDYRGYGRSGGHPSVVNMMGDCRVIFDFTEKWLKENGYTGPIVVMGRSLGSASALELAASRPDRLDGLIIESGFARISPLLALLGIDTGAIGLESDWDTFNLDKIKGFGKPTLIIHAEFDHIIPFEQGQALFDACAADHKKLLKIPGANHNDIFSRGLTEYMQAVKMLVGSLAK